MWQGFLSIPETAGAGTWAVGNIQAYDVAGNYRSVNAPDPPTNQGALTVTDATAVPPTAVPPPQGTDTTAPQISALTVSPASVQAGDAVTLTVHAPDDASGVVDLYASLDAGDGPHDGYPRFTRVSGTARDGIWKALFVVPDTARASTW